MRRRGFLAIGSPLIVVLLCIGIAPLPSSCDNNSVPCCSVSLPRPGSYQVSYSYFGISTTTIVTGAFPGPVSVCHCHSLLGEPRLIGAPENARPDCSQARPSTTPVTDPNFDSLELSILGVTDPDGDPLTIKIDSIFQDEPTGGLFEADPTPDALLNERNPGVARLRAERDPLRDGRVYTANFSATDGIDFCQGTVKVCYPIGPGGDCADGGPAFDSTKKAEIDLSVSIIDSPDPINVGDDLTYDITVNNNSSLIVTTFGLVDELPSGVDFVSASTGCRPVAFNGVLCSHGPLAGGTSTTFTVVGRPTAMGAITNLARIATEQNYSIDPDSSNDAATVTTTVGQVSDADLAVIITDNPDPVTRGGAVTYAVTATNNGPATATGVVLTDSLPPLEINSSDILVSQGSFIKLRHSNTITCNFGTLASGASATLTVTGFTVTAGTITNTASATAAEPDPNTTNNSGSEDTTVNSPVAMTLLAPWLDQGQLSLACQPLTVRGARFDGSLDVSRTPWLTNLFWSWRNCSQPNSRRG